MVSESDDSSANVLIWYIVKLVLCDIFEYPGIITIMKWKFSRFLYVSIPYVDHIFLIFGTHDNFQIYNAC